MKPTREASAHRPATHGGPFSVGRQNRPVLDFSSSVSPAGPPPAVEARLERGLASIGTYPDPDSWEMRKALWRYTGIPPSRIAAGNGATELIHNYCQAFLSRGTRVLIPVPTFGEYEAAARLRGARISFLKTMDLNGSVDELIRMIPAAGCVFLCNPNNPTGALASRENVARIIAAAKKKSAHVIVDECFMELACADESVMDLTGRNGNLLVLRSLTKSFGLAGIRAGYALGPARIIGIMNRIKIPWNVSGLAQVAAVEAVRHPAHVAGARRLIKKESEFLCSKISAMDGFRCGQTAANYILVRTRLRARTIRDRLLKHGILVRDCSSFRGLGGNYIRIAVRKRRDNKALIHAMGEI